MRADGQIDYVEFPGLNLARIASFYNNAFGWAFEALSPNYVAFDSQGLDGGFSSNPRYAPAKPRVVLYAEDLESMERRVRMAGGFITQEIYDYEGGRRFHFLDPSANELGVWSPNHRSIRSAVTRDGYRAGLSRFRLDRPGDPGAPAELSRSGRSFALTGASAGSRTKHEQHSEAAHARRWQDRLCGVSGRRSAGDQAVLRRGLRLDVPGLWSVLRRFRGRGG